MRISPFRPSSLLLCALVFAASLCVLAPSAAIAQQSAKAPEKLTPVPERPREIQSPEHEEDDDDLLLPLKRNLWFQQQRAFPYKHIPNGAFWRAQGEREALVARHRAMLRGMTPELAAQVDPLSLLEWTPDGPQPVAAYFGSVPYSGRATSIAVHPTDPNTIYLGTAAGGVWKTTDGGQLWKPMSDTQASLAIGAVAVDPNNPQNVFAGTGEPDFSGDSYYGQGLLKSTNGGVTWQLIRAPFAQGDTAPPFAQIAVQPGNSQIVLAANLAGLYRSADGGTTWTVVVNSGMSAVLFDVKNHSIVYAGAGGYGTSSGPLLKSTDAGKTWTPMNGTGSNSVPALSAVLRSSIAEDGTGKTLIAAFARSDYGSPGSVYRSIDGGANWTQLTSPPAIDWYRTAIAVVPANPLVLYTTGAGLYQSTDGGKTWAAVGGEAYADQHAFAFSADGTRLYLADDGGVFVNTSPAAANASFTSLNTSINTLTFYPHFSNLAGKPNAMLGGSQDHGVNLYTGELAWLSGEQSGFCGDGNGVYIDPKGEYAYVHCQGGSANWASNATGGNTTTAWVSAQSGINTADRWPWVADIEGDQKNVAIVYTGTNRLYKSSNYAASWTAISPDLTYGGNISTIGVSPSDSTTIYVGSNDGKVSVTTNATAGASATWKTLTGLPNRYISKIAVQPDSDKDVYVTVNGFDVGHVFHSLDGGATWKDISGNLPHTPANSILVDPNIPTTIYLATDTGVYVSENTGASWVPLGSGLPNVVVQDIGIYQPTRTLRVITHGRGAWDAVLKQVIPLSVTVNPSPVDAPQSATVTVTLNLPAPAGGALLQLTSSNSTVFPLPASITVPAGSTVGSATVQVAKITAPTAVTLRASYSGATAVGAVTLNPGSFTLSANTTAQTVTQGKSAVFTIKVQSLNNFSARVTPTALNLPTGYLKAGTAWNPLTVTPAANGSASSTLTVATSSTTVPGAYKVNLQGLSAGYATPTLPVTITVLEAPAPKITSVSPASLVASGTAQTVTIQGANFLSGDTLTFTPPGGLAFASIPASLKFVSSTQLTYLFNNGSTQGKWTIVVNSPDGLSHSNAGTVTVTSTTANPIPTVTGFAPASLWAGADPQVLRIVGTGFLYSSTVTFNGIAHPATYVGPTILSIALTAADLAKIGAYPVVVTNPAPGGGASIAAKFSVTLSPWTWMSGSNQPNVQGVVGKQGAASTAYFPGSRAGSVSWTDPSGNFWLFGGSGYDAGTYLTSLNDLWQFNPTSKTWAWISGGAVGVYYGSYGQLGVASTGNIPGSRAYSTNWIDPSGNLWLFGGMGWDAGSGFGPMNDLWEFNPATKAWTWVSGSNLVNPSGKYGTKGIPGTANTPGARQSPVSWTDASGNFWLFGGFGLDASGKTGYLNDLWEFTPATKSWTWVSGGSAVVTTNSGPRGVYGTKGTAAAANVPGGRQLSVSWTDPTGNLWLFGGNGIDSTGVLGFLNDLWVFNIKNKTWTWVTGSNAVGVSNSGPKGVYGTIGVTAATSVPGGRDAALSWTDTAGNRWLYGGDGIDATGYLGWMDDLWVFNPAARTWTWMSGSSAVNAPPVFGTKGVGSVSNIPGGRLSSTGWADGAGNLWLFGGSDASGYRNDVWRYQQ